MALKSLTLHSSNIEISNLINENSYRIKINYPLESVLTLINRKEIEIGIEEENTVVFIENIGPGGLRFLSNLKLMVDQKIIFSFETEEINEIHIQGVIIWKDEMSEGLYMYGVHFYLEENTRAQFTELLNDYSEKHFTRNEG
ncbi:PilZ domain-containing protein [Neobacillus sp. OS1-33]|uniref:PilZ domain-containing protein n=1 Tax=Neobacillus sp. OS1-33 TaxID=3070683 RepID=UPI0027E13341|nr:PilZ domain-containing protein [Neobacillus sp. OS1-33]WML24782.1 PilZ domain-containing protein [Neobacillus sp. OS1-33]